MKASIPLPSPLEDITRFMESRRKCRLACRIVLAYDGAVNQTPGPGKLFSFL